jgi:hypothetical protein
VRRFDGGELTGGRGLVGNGVGGENWGLGRARGDCGEREEDGERVRYGLGIERG